MKYLDKRLLRWARNTYTRMFEDRRKIYWGTIDSFQGSTTYTALGEHWTWVRIFGRPEGLTPILNPTALTEEGTRVLIARDPRSPSRWRIISVDDSYSSETNQIPFSQFNVGIHGDSHQVFDESTPGPDPVHVGLPMLMMLKTEGDGATLTVTTHQYSYTINGAYRVSYTQTTDLTSYVPGTVNKIRKVLLYLDRGTNTLQVVAGTIVDDDGITPIPEPAPPIGVDARESAWVTLANGQSTISTAIHIKDARDFLDNGQASGVPTPTEIGQILMYLDGGVAWATPVISEDYTWMANEDGELIVEG
jgi:hypothetical protein